MRDWCQNYLIRDKTTKEIVSFKTMLQVAKNFEQCEKAKAIMQQAKGPIEQVNYTTAQSCPQNRNKTGVRVTTEAQRHPQSPSKTRVKIFLTASAKLAPVSIVQVRHTLAPNAQLQTSDAVVRAVGESDTLPVHAEWRHPLYPAPPRHTILVPLWGRSMKLTSLRWISNKKSMPKVSTAPHKILIAWWWAVSSSATWTRSDQGPNQIDQGAVGYHVHLQHTPRKTRPITDSSWAEDHKLPHP